MYKNKYVLKTVLTSLFFSFMVSAVVAQTNAVATDQPVTMDDLELKPMRLPALQEVGGSPFMTADYQAGTVQIADNRSISNVPVKYNIFSNAIMIQKEGQDLRLESFQTVSYDITGNDGALKHIMFRQGYPEIDNQTTRSVYQVLSMGPKVHLVKFISQKVEDAATLGDYSRREIVTTQQLYVYTPGGELKRIKASKQSLTDALPALSAKIDEVVNAQKLNLKNEAGITELVDALNKP
ncbi:MAG: hypothetical protein H7Y01_07750 [Ferruginibacter sp.]|nr:hypothetical protein [Chitinophagaceae bacterium]